MKIEWSTVIAVVLALVVFKLLDKYALSKLPGLESFEY